MVAFLARSFLCWLAGEDRRADRWRVSSFQFYQDIVKVYVRESKIHRSSEEFILADEDHGQVKFTKDEKELTTIQ